MWGLKFKIDASICDIDKINNISIIGHKNFEMMSWNMMRV